MSTRPLARAWRWCQQTGSCRHALSRSSRCPGPRRSLWMPGRTKPGVVRKMKVLNYLVAGQDHTDFLILMHINAVAHRASLKAPVTWRWISSATFSHPVIAVDTSWQAGDASSETLRVYRGQDGRLLTRVDLGESLEDQPLSTVKCVQGLVLDEEENIYVVDGFNHRSSMRVFCSTLDTTSAKRWEFDTYPWPQTRWQSNILLPARHRLGGSGWEQACRGDGAGWEFRQGNPIPAGDVQPLRSMLGIFAFDVDGELINQFDGSNREYDGAQVGENKLVCPLAITQGSDGCLYVCDGGAHDIKIFTSQGQFVRKIGESKNASCDSRTSMRNEG
eukprot:759257-Hanusia_phi.AAC.4